jgi:hypothetical protein
MYGFQTTGAYAVRLTADAEYFRIVKDDGSLGYVRARMYDGAEAGNWTATRVAKSGTYAFVHGLVDAGIPNHGPGSRPRRREHHHHHHFTTHSLSPRQAYRNCNASQQSSIIASIQSANAYIAETNRYFANPPSIASRRYRTWFGQYNKARWDTVKAHFVALRNQPESFTYDCSCESVDTYAYVYPNRFGIVYLCGLFWEAPANGTDSGAGTIIHEATHFIKIAGTLDHMYGQKGAQQLAKTSPRLAVMNAE